MTCYRIAAAECGLVSSMLRRVGQRIGAATAAAAFVAVAAATAAVAATHAPAAGAQTWPSKPVRFVVNFPPGGPLDLAARAVAERVSAAVNQPVVVENRPGAAGNIGADAVARAAADGYTVLFTIDTPFTVNPAIYSKLPFRLEDFRPLSLIGSSGLMFAVHPSLGVKTLEAFIAKAKAQEVTFSSAGNGSPGHLASAILAEHTGAKVVHVPYKGNAPAVAALVGGEVQAAIIATPGLLPHVQAGKLHALAVTSRQRSPIATDVPTGAEAGLPPLEFEVQYLALAPRGVPDDVADALQKAITAAVASDEVRQRLLRLDLHPSGEIGAAVEQRMVQLRQRYEPVIRKIELKVE
ncbi:MAG TPA: tripartite tricarboxylate transporter substrate binding protein [Burkholderiaceae bacterium]|nr:tripartite tricarboxylate transporter substrate binding protein [Burkholderiaceae bacterium]